MEFAVHGDHDNVVDALLKHLEHLPENEVRRIFPTVRSNSKDLKYCRCHHKQLNRSLVLASDLGHLKVLKTLLDAQAIIEYSEPGFLYGHTAIVRAICNGHISVVSALLERQPTMNVRYFAINTLLWIYIRMYFVTSLHSCGLLDRIRISIVCKQWIKQSDYVAGERGVHFGLPAGPARNTANVAVYR